MPQLINSFIAYFPINIVIYTTTLYFNWSFINFSNTLHPFIKQWFLVLILCFTTHIITVLKKLAASDKIVFILGTIICRITRPSQRRPLYSSFLFDIVTSTFSTSSYSVRILRQSWNHTISVSSSVLCCTSTTGFSLKLFSAKSFAFC